MKKFFFLVFPCILLLSVGLFSVSQAQQAVLTTSDNAGGSNGSVSYSVGQTAYLSQSGTNGFIIEGVQQPYEIQFMPGVEEMKDYGIDCSVFPNPTSGEVTLKIEPRSHMKLRYRLSGIRGELILENPVEASQQVIPMETLSPGTYFLTLLEIETALKTYKIIKR